MSKARRSKSTNGRNVRRYERYNATTFKHMCIRKYVNSFIYFMKLGTFYTKLYFKLETELWHERIVMVIKCFFNIIGTAIWPVRNSKAERRSDQQFLARYARSRWVRTRGVDCRPRGTPDHLCRNIALSNHFSIVALSYL